MSSRRHDGYRRGRDAESDEDETAVSPVYRPLVGIVWALGAVIVLVVFGSSIQGAAAAFVVSHIFLAGLVYADIRSLRKQGVEWGLSRHLWLWATLFLPFVAPAYYWYSGRVVRRENERRGVGGENSTDHESGGDGAN
jgi:hypothetical protein